MSRPSSLIPADNGLPPEKTRALQLAGDGRARSGVAVRSTDYDDLQVNLQQKLLSFIPQDDLTRFTEPELRVELTRLVGELLSHAPELLGQTDPERLIQQILDERYGFGLI